MKYFISFFFISLTLSCSPAENNHLLGPALIVNNLEVSKGEFTYLLAKKISHYDSYSSQNKKLFTKLKKQLVRELTETLLVQSWCKANNFYISKDDLSRSINPLKNDYGKVSLLTAILERSSIDKNYWLNSIKREHYKKILTTSLRNGINKPKKNNRTFKKVGIKIYTTAEENLAKEIIKLSNGVFPFDQLESAYTPLLLNYNKNATFVTSKTMGYYSSALSMKKNKKSRLKESSFGYQFFRVVSREDAALPVALDKKELDKAYREWLSESLAKASVSIDSQLIDSIIVKTRG